VLPCRLPAKYYGGVVEAPAARTTYKWSFAGQAPAHGSDSVGMNAFLEDSDDRWGGLTFFFFTHCSDPQVF
jgi:hypothetical protein